MGILIKPKFDKRGMLRIILLELLEKKRDCLERAEIQPAEVQNTNPVGKLGESAVTVLVVHWFSIKLAHMERKVKSAKTKSTCNAV